MMKKKQQRIPLAIDGDYAELILPELSYQLWNKYKLRSKIINHNFDSDPVWNVDLLFMETDEITKKIIKSISEEYELISDEI